MVYRIFTEKKETFAYEADMLKEELSKIVGIKGIENLRVLNRYDVEGIGEDLFKSLKYTLFADPQVEEAYDDVKLDDGSVAFAVDLIPGQFNQRAESCIETIALLNKGEKPLVKTAKLYIFKGALKDDDIDKIKKYMINPVETREVSLEKYKSLKFEYEEPEKIKVLDSFRDMGENDLEKFIEAYGLAMDKDDLSMCVEYFNSLHRDPTVTEIKLIDTYWSDHCRHTTFNTTIDKISFDDPKIEESFNEYLTLRKEMDVKKPISLMNIGTIIGGYLEKSGKLDKLDKSKEINACTVKINIDVDGKPEKWLLYFKNETHNHPTEIEPSGGASTCLGGAIRDPLSGRSFVYAAMRITGASNPLEDVSETIQGKLPQRKIVQTAAEGYSLYGNQIGVPAGIVDEIYHPGYVAKRMELGAVVAAAPQENVVRMEPVPGDCVILLGGKTGRDGIGGATGASKSQTVDSFEVSSAEVQKGKPLEERKMLRLFRNPEVSRMIKRCNDFGAGGVSVAIGELADGLLINLDKVPPKYGGMDGTELALSESQERMAVVVAAEDVDRFKKFSDEENLDATVVARVTEEPYIRMDWRGDRIVDIERAFLDTNGAEKHIEIQVPKYGIGEESDKDVSFKEKYLDLAADLNICSKRGLSEVFDSTAIGGTVLMPFGGRKQRTPIQSMVHLIPVEKGTTDDCSIMSWGYNPDLSSADPYIGAYMAVIESVSKLVAAGGSTDDTYLSFQEYFPKPAKDPKRWAAPLSALLGAFKAQKELEIASVGGKDSMSGSFEDIDVPPTLVSFAITTAKASDIISPEFKKPGHKVYIIEPERDENNLPTGKSLHRIFSFINKSVKNGSIVSAYTLGFGGLAEAVLKMSIGNDIGFTFADAIEQDLIFAEGYGSFVVEVEDGFKPDMGNIRLLGETSADGKISFKKDSISLYEIFDLYEKKLDPVYPAKFDDQIKGEKIYKAYTYKEKNPISASTKCARPRVLIPVFPGTNGEYEIVKAFSEAGAETELFIFKNLTPDDIDYSMEKLASRIKEAQVIFIPGGSSCGDQPESGGKFIAAVLRNPVVSHELSRFLDERGGLMGGICNGFQALVKLGLLPFGKIVNPAAENPALTYNEIRRHKSGIVYTRIASNKSPWMRECEPGEIYAAPISCTEGKFVASEEMIETMVKNGQIAAQYVDLEGNVTYDTDYNPHASYHAIESITSPDGRIIGKIAHNERTGKNLYKNVPGNYDFGMFRSAVKYFK